MTIRQSIAPATSSQPQRLVLSPFRDPDRQMVSGVWLASDTVREVRR